MLRVLNINIEALFNKNKRFLTFILIVTCYYYLFGVCLNHSDGFKYSWVRRLLLEHIEDVCLGLVNVDLPSLGGVSKGFSLSGISRALLSVGIHALLRYCWTISSSDE